MSSPYTTRPGYSVEWIDVEMNDDDPLVCPDCGWTGTVADTAQVIVAVLTAGDPSPLGRCPGCDNLLYPDGKK